MRRTLCKSKIHNALLTDANLKYEGSVTIDRDLMDAADLVPHERVQVLNRSNGVRLETYVIEGGRGSGRVCLNGPAARLGQPGDVVVIIAYGEYEEAEVVGHEPRVVKVDDHNRPLRPRLETETRP